MQSTAIGSLIKNRNCKKHSTTEHFETKAEDNGGHMTSLHLPFSTGLKLTCFTTLSSTAFLVPSGLTSRVFNLYRTNAVDTRSRNLYHWYQKLARTTPCPPKKEATKLLAITFSNLNRFSKLFHDWIEDEYFQQNCVIFSTTAFQSTLNSSIVS